MKTKVKYSLIGLIIGIILTTATPVLADSIIQKIDVIFNSVQVQVNGEKLDTNSILYNGSTYLPMRTVAEAVGKDIDWNQETMTANIIEKKENIVDSTLPTIIDYGFKNDGDSTNYAVTFSDLFTVGLNPSIVEIPGYKSMMISAYVKNMDKGSIISTPIITGFNNSGNEYNAIGYNIYSVTIPEEYKEGFKKYDFFENYNSTYTDSFGGSIFFEGNAIIDSINYDDGVHKCTLYINDNN